MASVIIPAVSIDEYLSMRHYFERCVMLTRRPCGQHLQVLVEQFLASVNRLLGGDAGATLAQVAAAKQRGASHCDLVVDVDTTVDLTHTLLEFLHRLDELRHAGHSDVLKPPVEMRAFLLSCQAVVNDTVEDAVVRPSFIRHGKVVSPTELEIGPRPLRR